MLFSRWVEKNLSIRIKSLDARIYPDVYPNYYIDSRDYDTVVEGVLLIKDIISIDSDLFIDDILLNNQSIEESIQYLNHIYGSSLLVPLLIYNSIFLIQI